MLGAEHAGERLDKLVARLLPAVSRSTVQRWIAEGRVCVDGAPCTKRDLGRPGAVVEVTPGPEPRSEAEPEPGVEFGVLYEDEQLIVVDKPAGLVVHPARGHRTFTLVGGLLARPGFGRPPTDERDREGALRPGMVQRLDKDTSGVLVVAKTALAREALKAQLAAHTFERAYVAITCGNPRSTTIRTLYGRHPRSRLKFTSRLERGRPAVTHVSVLERLARGRAALVECRLETGRTHQIRVHLAEQLGFPVLADALYGGARPRDPELARVASELGRQALHARLLGFMHPVSGEALRFEAPLPADFRRALEALRKLGS